MNLYQLTAEFLQVKNQLEEMELDQETLNDTLDSLQLPIEEKIENIIKYMKSLEALADAKKLEAKRLSESASSDLKKAESLKAYMSDSLTTAGIKNLQAGIFEVKFQKGREVVQVEDESVIPWGVSNNDGVYFPLKIEQDPKLISKTELKKLVKDGIEIPGVEIVRNPDSLVVK